MRILSFGKNIVYRRSCPWCMAELEFTDADICSINKSIDFGDNGKIQEMYKDEPYIRFITCPACGKIDLIKKE